MNITFMSAYDKHTKNDRDEKLSLSHFLPMAYINEPLEQHFFTLMFQKNDIKQVGQIFIAF